MTNYRFYTDIVVRYGDLDPQGHVNNSRFFTFIEQARILYLTDLGLWQGGDFLDLGLIVADAHVAFLAPIKLGQTVRVWTRVTRIGNKSLNFEYDLVDAQTGDRFARGDTVMVAYDYHTDQTIPVPADWRSKITVFDGLAQQTHNPPAETA